MSLNNIQSRTLANGLKVICLRKNSAPIASFQLWYRTGSANEHDGVYGVSHILEHMMFRGSVNVGPEEHAQRINDVGGHCNAFTAEDVTAYTNSVPARHLEMALKLEADRMNGILLNPAILETERKVIIEEYHTYMNNPVTKAFLEFRRNFYGTHPYALGPLGKIEDIERVTANDCMTYYRQWYSPDNAVAVIVGDFKDEEALFAMVDKYFGAFPRGDAASRTSVLPPPPTVNAGEMKRVVEFDVPLMLVGYPAPPSAHKDAVPLDILQMILSQGETSRMHREIVRRQATAVMAGGMNHFLKNSGMSLFFAAFTPDIAPSRVRQSITTEIKRVRDKGVTAEEVQKVKNVTLANRVFEMYSAEHLSQRLGFSETVEGDFRHWTDRLRTLEQLDSSTLTEVANRYWNDSQRNVLFLKPKKVNPLLFIVGWGRRVGGLFSRKESAHV